MTTMLVLRTILGMKPAEFAEKFACTGAYISAIENGTRSMKFQTLCYGLNNLGISYDRYLELDSFVNSIANEELDEQNKRRLMMLKAMSITETDEEVKKKYDALIEMIINAKTQKRGGR